MPNPLIDISDVESRVMDVLWKLSPQTADDIVAEPTDPTGWHAKTINILINRLLG